jgi:radical SAM superfamily enzyme with C-terminal helix-hairpin-helix motif
MNPITVVKWPEKAKEGIRVIAEHNTPGDTAAFGLESADPVVREQNELQVTADQCFEAVRIVNEAAGWRPGGDRDAAPTHGDGAVRRLPKLLPGINLLHGLQGEREETYELNKQFLQRVYDAGLMLRRVNIRQVMAFEGTEMSDTGATIAQEHTKLFKQYKREVRAEIDQPMLRRVAPPGTVLPDVHLEYHQDGKTFGRQLGTYPLLVAVPGERPLGATIDVAVTDHGYRSVTGVPHPLDANSASLDELTAIPGLGQGRAGDIVVNRPYESSEEVPAGEVVVDEFLTVRETGHAD